MTRSFSHNRAGQIAARIIAAVAFVACWRMLLDYEITDHLVLAMLLTYVLSLVAIFVHEAGHALAASRYRQRVEAFAVVPFELRFRPLRLSLAAARAPGDVGGYVIYSDGDPSRRTVGIIAAAGPLASFALGAGAAAAGLLLMASLPYLGEPLVIGVAGAPRSAASVGLPSDAEVMRFVGTLAARNTQEMWAGCCYALAILSTGLGLANLIPTRGSDGAFVLDCLIRSPLSSNPSR